MAWAITIIITSAQIWICSSYWSLLRPPLNSFRAITRTSRSEFRMSIRCSCQYPFCQLLKSSLVWKKVSLSDWRCCFCALLRELWFALRRTRTIIRLVHRLLYRPRLLLWQTGIHIYIYTKSRTSTQNDILTIRTTKLHPRTTDHHRQRRKERAKLIDYNTSHHQWLCGSTNSLL